MADSLILNKATALTNNKAVIPNREDMKDPLFVYAQPMIVIATTDACDAIINRPLDAGSGAG